MPTQTDALLLEQVVSVLRSVQGRIQGILRTMEGEGEGEDVRKPVEALLPPLDSLIAQAQQAAAGTRSKIRVTPRFVAGAFTGRR